MKNFKEYYKQKLLEDLSTLPEPGENQEYQPPVKPPRPPTGGIGSVKPILPGGFSDLPYHPTNNPDGYRPESGKSPYGQHPSLYQRFLDIDVVKPIRDLDWEFRNNPNLDPFP